MTPAPLYTPEAVAEALGVSPRTVHAWIAAGELKPTNVSRTPGSRKPRLRVSEAALQQFLASREVGAPERRAPRRKLPAVKQYV